MPLFSNLLIMGSFSNTVWVLLTFSVAGLGRGEWALTLWALPVALTLNALLIATARSGRFIPSSALPVKGEAAKPPLWDVAVQNQKACKLAYGAELTKLGVQEPRTRLSCGRSSLTLGIPQCGKP